MGWFVNLIGSFLSGPITQISNDIKETKIAIENAKNDRERIAAEERLALLEARKSLIQSTQSNPLDRIIRFLWALPFVIYVNKIIIWDKVLGWGVTDPISTDLKDMMLIILGGYFIDTLVGRFKR